MFVPGKKVEGPLTDAVNAGNWPGVDSTYRLIVVAALRSKQLLHGSVPRIAFDPHKRRNTSIALEEVKQGLVPFTINDGLHSQDGGEQGALQEVVSIDGV